jgi:hypothetical protein
LKRKEELRKEGANNTYKLLLGTIFKNRRLWVEREHNTEFIGSVSDPVEQLVGRSFCALAELL